MKQKYRLNTLIDRDLAALLKTYAGFNHNESFAGT